MSKCPTKRSPAELAWSGRSLRFRLDLLNRFRLRLLAERESLLLLLAELRPHCSRSELISSEIIPLLDNASYLNSQAESILRPQRLGRRGQPVWLFGVDTVIHREALGRVLVIGPGNYPLFLPMVQAFYAWAAGNSVWLKSAPGSTALHDRVRDLFLSIGGPAEVFRLLGEDNEAYPQALIEGVDKVVLVGSAATGQAVLSQAGHALVPCVAELSGWDAVFVHPTANLPQVASAVAFGLALNGGRTCVAPRRIFLRGDLEEFETLLDAALRLRPRVPLSPDERALVETSVKQGCRALGGHDGPTVLSRVGRDHALLRDAAFGGLAVLYVPESDQEALEVAANCPFALGASLFGPPEWAQSLAHKVPAQVVSINDIIVSSADPRVPFGGSGRSGFGRMRGREGLLEMTATRVVSQRQGGTLDHLRPPSPNDDGIVERFLLLAHGGGLAAKSRALAEMIFLIGRERVRLRRRARELEGVSRDGSG
jgi:acyl-CoA reductase-like NAD-dependent aldehyde dehydrogenase